jgi:hypothetical protein
MAWSNDEKTWARAMVRDFFYMGEAVNATDLETLLFAEAESDRRQVVRAYARDVMKAVKLERKTVLEEEIDAIDAEVAVMPTE